MYENVCEELMALPGIYGRKTEKKNLQEQFLQKNSIMQSLEEKLSEGPAFHFDGQNFAKAYNIKFLDKKKKKIMPGKTHGQFQQECSGQCLQSILIIKG